MDPLPKFQAPLYLGAGKLAGKVALITGGDSGIGRSVSVLYARDGARVAVLYLAPEQSDAEETRRVVEAEGQKCLLLRRGLRVVVVEGSADSAALAQQMLGAGHEVVTARNGTEALVVADSFLPAAVLIDIGLPGLDGFHVAGELRKRAGDLLLIATTGRSGPEAEHSTNEAGFDHHLVKPLDFPRIVELLANVEEPDQESA